VSESASQAALNFRRPVNSTAQGFLPRDILPLKTV